MIDSQITLSDCRVARTELSGETSGTPARKQPLSDSVRNGSRASLCHCFAEAVLRCATASQKQCFVVPLLRRSSAVSARRPVSLTPQVMCRRSHCLQASSGTNTASDGTPKIATDFARAAERPAQPRLPRWTRPASLGCRREFRPQIYHRLSYRSWPGPAGWTSES